VGIDAIFGLWQGEARHELHEHPDARIVIPIDGMFHERLHDRTIACERGTAIYRDAGEAHSDTYNGTGSYVCIVMADRTPSSVPSILGSSSRFLRHPALQAIASRVAAEVARGDTWSGIAMQGHSLEICARLGRSDEEPSSSPRCVKNVIELLHADPAADLTLERIAAAVGESPSTWVAPSGGTSASVSRNTSAASGWNAFARCFRPAPSP
jgi:hypothetical protein